MGKRFMDGPAKYGKAGRSFHLGNYGQGPREAQQRRRRRRRTGRSGRHH